MLTQLESFLLHCQREQLHLYVAKHPGCIVEAIELIIADKQPFSWRAAWLVFHGMVDNDRRICKHINALATILPKKVDGEQREILKILYRMHGNENTDGLLFDQAAGLWQNVNKQASVRVNALKLLCKITLNYPEMLGEFNAMTQPKYFNKLSGPMRKSIDTVLKSFNRQLKNATKSRP